MATTEAMIMKAVGLAAEYRPLWDGELDEVEQLMAYISNKTSGADIRLSVVRYILEMLLTRVQILEAQVALKETKDNGRK